MTIDLDALYESLGYVHAPKIDELFRLARLGQQRERERCGTCAYRETKGPSMCFFNPDDWSCADWEGK